MQKIFLIILLWSSTSSALVDMKNASFTDYWIDFVFTGSGYELKIDRKYSSRSLFSGIYGFGWCSTIENKITITLEGNLLLSECDGNSNVSYYPANFNTQLISDSVEKIISLLKKRDSDQTKSYFDDLKEKMLQDHKLRTKIAGDVGYKIVPVKNTIFLANGKDVDRIAYDGENYVRTLADGTVHKFDNQGKLVAMYDKAKNWVRVSYSGDVPSHIIDNQGRKITFTYNAEKKVRQILAPNNLAMTYKFNGENLIGVTNAWKNNYSYEYDSGHNLIKMNFPDGTNKAISYNEIKDWVKQFKDRDGCTEAFDFTLSPNDPKNHYWSTAVKNCKGKVANKSRYEFWYQERPDHEKYLNRVLTEKNGEVLDISYHQDFAKPISIRQNGTLTTFTYFPNGLVKTKTVGNPSNLKDPLFEEDNKEDVSKYAITYDYDNQNRVSETLVETFSKTNKPVRRRKTAYKYDAAGRLASAKNSDGQFVELKYNTLGLLSEISDHAKKEIVIDYDAKLLKPTSISRPSVGSLLLSYNARGEIAKIKDKGGSSVRSQIRSTFNNLVDVIGPASSELNLTL